MISDFDDVGAPSLCSFKTSTSFFLFVLHLNEVKRVWSCWEKKWRESIRQTRKRVVIGKSDAYFVF